MGGTDGKQEGRRKNKTGGRNEFWKYKRKTFVRAVRGSFCEEASLTVKRLPVKKKKIINM